MEIVRNEWNKIYPATGNQEFLVYEGNSKKGGKENQMKRRMDGKALRGQNALVLEWPSIFIGGLRGG